VKKIGVFLTMNQNGGGAFQYSQSIVEAGACLPSEEFQVVIIYTFDEWEDYLKGYDLPHKKVKAGFLGRVFWGAWQAMGLPLVGWRKIGHFFQKLSREVIAQKCDLWLFPAQDAWSYRIPVSALVTIHDLMHRYEKRFQEVSSRGIYERRERDYRQVCNWARGVLVDSEVGKQQVIESYDADPNKIYILPFVPPRYIYGGGQPEDFDQRHQLPRKFLFYPGNFWDHKNHKSLVCAIKMLKSKYRDLTMVFVGQKRHGYESICELVEKLGLSKNVFILGRVPDQDMAEFYRRARGLIMPTFFGPTNIPPLEANALGCPVAVSRIYGMPGQLGDAAIYFDPSSVEDIAKAIEELWANDDLCLTLKERGLKRAGNWNQFHFNTRLYKILKDILE
jgi:glycosyltransferase involved in cell wall biosynthesis